MLGASRLLAVITLLVIHQIHSSIACNGYSVKLNAAKNCIDNSILKVENGGVTLDKECNIILAGCLSTAKGFKTATGSYHIKKAPMPDIDGDFDLCDSSKATEDPKIVTAMRNFGVPSSCPIAPGTKICGAPDKKINISKHKNQLGLAAGMTTVKLELDHDTGKSCIEIGITLSRSKLSKG